MLNLFARLKSFDVYRKVPKDYTQASIPGGVVSVICFIIVVVLFLSEFQDFLRVKTKSEMFVDVPHSSDALRININITLPELSCEILSLDAQDAMGKHVVDVTANVKKTRSGGGCNVKGFVEVARVPGNFHLSSHGKAATTMLNLEHHIHELSFGEANIIQTKKDEGIQGAFHPLDGTHRISSDLTTNYEYYIRVVPTTLQRMDGDFLHSYQFTVNANSWGARTSIGTFAYVPSVYFRYDFSPITVKYTQYRRGFLHFVVQVCAIIGGVFTVAGLFASVSTRLVDKINLGKAE